MLIKMSQELNVHPMPCNPDPQPRPSLPGTVTGSPRLPSLLSPQDNQKPILKADLQLHRDFI